jgi:hypothetical protein
LARVWLDTTSVVVRATEVDGTVLNTVCDSAVFITPFNVIEKSASNSSRSMADLSTPVTFWTSRGVEKSKFVMSFLMAVTLPLESSTDSVVQPIPVLLLIGQPPR